MSCGSFSTATPCGTLSTSWCLQHTSPRLPGVTTAAGRTTAVGTTGGIGRAGRTTHTRPRRQVGPEADRHHEVGSRLRTLQNRLGRRRPLLAEKARIAPARGRRSSQLEWLQSFQNPPAKKLRKEETNSEHGADLFKKAVVDRESSGRNHDDRSELGSAAGKRAPSGAPEVSSKPLEGRSQDLERPFMRFSEAPRPEEVRPLPVLREAFKKTREKWTKDQDWSYVGEMLRSIRQDLTIQMLRDIFVVEVHEYWAQLALEVGDFKQFDQAAVQLQAYYADPTLEKGATKLNEVLAWRLLYLTVEGEGIATTEFLRRNAQRLDFSVPVVKLAWRLRRAISQRCHTKAMHMLAPPKTEGQMTGEDDVPPVLPESLRAELLRRVKLAQLMEVCKAVRENMSRSRLESLGLLEDESDPTIQMPIVYQKDDLVDTKATYEEAKKQLEPTLLRENGVGDKCGSSAAWGDKELITSTASCATPGKLSSRRSLKSRSQAQERADEGAFAELWAHIFRQLRALASDARPEVRNCAVKSLATALLSHGRKVGPACYQRCLSDILMKIAEMSAARKQGRPAHEAPLIVHHSRDTPEKQWDEKLWPWPTTVSAAC
ncbi:unnamed protein product [Effrenium voratum]|nr:unnamed protein product [Effrenium voratum]